MQKTTVVVLLMAVVFLPSFRTKPVSLQTINKAYLIARCRELEELAEPRLGGDFLLTGFIEELGKRKDFEALRFLATSDVPGSATAASVYVAHAGSTKAVQFTSQLMRGKERRYAIWSLSFYPKNEIFPFFRDLADSPYACCHVACYNTGMARGWNDFIDVAWTDVENTDCAFDEEHDTIGFLAREYLRQFEKTRSVPDEPLPPGFEK
jgi:hypothetical protein